MNILQRIGLLGMSTVQKKIGDILTATVMIETPMPLHGVAFKLAAGENLEYIPESISWGDLFSGSDDVCNTVDGDLYIERAQTPDKTSTPASTWSACTLQYRCTAAGSSEITLQDFIATRFREDVSIEQYETETKGALIEVVMQDSAGKVIARVEIS
jgi:hypothetical protein